MRKKLLLFLSVFCLNSLVHVSQLNAQAFIGLESGLVFNGYNDVQVPGNDGTPFSLKTDLKSEPVAFFRSRIGYSIKSKHTISVLYAPLKIKSVGSPNFPISFEGKTFDSQTPINATYTFNSYRITYRYRIINKENFELGLGFSGKIRDAEIELSSEDLSASKTNVGFVPLINFRLYWEVKKHLGVLFRGDALAAPQGRAEDVILAGTYQFSNQLQFRFGYRVLEGGADNDEVYNFTLFHYATIGVSYSFKRSTKMMSNN